MTQALRPGYYNQLVRIMPPRISVHIGYLQLRRHGAVERAVPQMPRRGAAMAAAVDKCIVLSLSATAPAQMT